DRPRSFQAAPGIRSRILLARLVTMSPRHLAVSVAILSFAARGLSAQGAVSGQVVITERPGEVTEDMNNAVVFLEPATGSKVKTQAATTSIALQARQFAPRV